MKQGFLSQYFTGVAAKRLSAVEADPKKSHQHEFNGTVLMKELFGEADRKGIPTRYIWFGNENEGLTEEGYSSWYDARRRHLTRTEYRLYFESNLATNLANQGDTILFAVKPNGGLIIIIASAESTMENQLLWLFGLPTNLQFKLEGKTLAEGDDTVIDFTARYILDELGIEIEEPEAPYLDELIDRYGLKGFPSTAEFSKFAWETLGEMDVIAEPDLSIINLMEHEERLFKRLERHIVAERLKSGFQSENEADVDGFISFSLSVQNRRKVRSGYALENHLGFIFDEIGLKYTNNGKSENNSRPDFVFPGIEQYHDEEFPVGLLNMLGVKTTCKDRWRQVLAEADRIANKHLFTLEPGISEKQTAEMQSKNLQLVLPSSLHKTYKTSQTKWLMSLSDFVNLIKRKQES